MVPPAVLLGLLALLVSSRVGAIVNTDTFFHLRLGDEFLHGWAPSSPESVSTFATADWLPTQWLGQIGMAWIAQEWGLAGVSVATGLLIVALLSLYFVLARAHVSLGLSVLLLLVAALASAPFLSGRPQMFSYAFAALVTAGWLNTWRGGRIPWWVIPLTWLWAMLHGMWSVSVIISGAAVLGLVLDARVRLSGAWRPAAVPLLALAAGCLTPMGPGLLTSVVRVGSISTYFAEWGPADFHSLGNLLALATLAGLGVIALRSREPMEWTPLLMTGVAAAWLFYSARTVPVAVAMLVPLASMQLAHVTRRPARMRLETPVLVLVLAAGVALCFTQSSQDDTDPRADSAAHASVDDLATGTPLLNAWGEGGYDMWRHRDLNIVMHGYGDMFTNDELDRNVDISDLESGWYDEVTGMGIRDALLPKGSRLAMALSEKGWTTLAEDPGAPQEEDAAAAPPLVHLRAPVQGAQT